jgi:hypothetical protein
VTPATREQRAAVLRRHVRQARRGTQRGAGSRQGMPCATQGCRICLSRRCSQLPSLLEPAAFAGRAIRITRSLVCIRPHAPAAHTRRPASRAARPGRGSGRDLDGADVCEAAAPQVHGAHPHRAHHLAELRRLHARRRARRRPHLPPLAAGSNANASWRYRRAHNDADEKVPIIFSVCR